jgi:hypothetical protein
VDREADVYHRSTERWQRKDEDMSREAIDALERWHATTRALREAKPGSAEFVRLRMIAQEQHAAYEALLDDDEERAGEMERVREAPATPASR